MTEATNQRESGGSPFWQRFRKAQRNQSCDLNRSEKPLTEELLEASRGAAAAVPTERDEIYWSLFDFAICVLAGRQSTTKALARGSAGELALSAHVLDRDDIHWPSLTHPGGVVWPVVLTAGLEANASVEQLVSAAALGYEVVVRLALAYGAGHRRFWQPTASAGVAGAAAAAAELLDPTGCSTLHAVGHALSVAGGSSRAISELSGTRFFHRVYAVETGIGAARLATGGIRGTRFGLEGEGGLLEALRADGSRSALSEQRVPAILESAPRIANVSGWALAAVEAASELGPIDSDAIQSVHVGVSETAHRVAGARAPTTVEQAMWSIPYCVVETLVAGAITLGSRTIVEEQMVALAERETISSDQEDLSRGATQTILPLSQTDAPNGQLWPASECLTRSWRPKTSAAAMKLLSNSSRRGDRGCLRARCCVSSPRDRSRRSNTGRKVHEDELDSEARSDPDRLSGAERRRTHTLRLPCQGDN